MTTATFTIGEFELKLAPVEATPENAIRLIKKWNYMFEITGLDSLTNDRLMEELAFECALHKSDKERAPIQQVSDRGVTYTPVNPCVLVTSKGVQKWMRAAEYWAMEKRRREAGVTSDDVGLWAAGVGTFLFVNRYSK